MSGTPSASRGLKGRDLITVGILLSYLINYLLSGAEAWRLMLGLASSPRRRSSSECSSCPRAPGG